MELYKERPPEYVSHNPDAITLPSVPQHDFGQPVIHADVTLPDLKTVLSSPAFQRASPPSNFVLHGSPAATSVRSLPPIDAINGPHGSTGKSAESAVLSPSEEGSTIGAEEPGIRSTSAVSMDDPDVRIAAEALSGLGNPGREI